MAIIGRRVYHKKWGEGTIEELINSRYIKVRFSKEKCEKEVVQFAYPGCFCKFLDYQDEEPKKNAKGVIIEDLRKKKHDYLSKDFSAIEKCIIAAYNELKTEAEKGSHEKCNFPSDYNDYWNQACYVLRYMYAYSREYYEVFLNIADMGITKEKIKILSFGCGAMQDLWALQEAIKFTKKTTSIDYTGVDKVYWKEEFIPEVDDNIKKSFKKCKAGEYAENSSLDFDIFFFPKSIGDIARNNDMDFRRIVKAFSHISKDAFYLAFSLIKNDKENIKDYACIDLINKTILNNNYILTEKRNKQGINVNSKVIESFPTIHHELFEQSFLLTDKKMMASRYYDNYLIFKYVKVT